MSKRILWCVWLGVAVVAVCAMAVSGTGTSTAPLAKSAARTAPELGSIRVHLSQPGPDGNVALGWREINSPGAISRESIESRVATELARPVRADAETPQAALFDGSVEEVVLGAASDDHHTGSNLDVRCVLSNTEHPGVSWINTSLLVAGDKVKVWFNPRTCGASPYPFRIDSVDVAIYAPGAGRFDWCVDIECPLVPGDSCSGPSYALQTANCYYYTWTAAAGYRFKLNINPDVCVSGPFFLGIEYVSWTGSPSARPSVMWDTSGISPICTQYLCDPTCTDWRDIFQQSSWGRIRCRVFGNTGDACSPIACQAAQPCTVTCQTGDIIECAETPGASHLDNDCDGGCFSNPPQFGSIACGQTVCGRAFTYTVDTTNYRDTDWYLFTLTEYDSVHVTAYAEFPLMIGVVDTDGCVDPSFIATRTNTFACSTTVLVSPCLAPGTYAVWVSPAAFTGIETPADYRVSLQCISCQPCLPLPPNDDCANVTPVGLPATFTGNNSCATEDCPVLAGNGQGETWHAFTVTDTCDVIVDYCGTNPSFVYFYTILFTSCPCGSYISRSSYDFTTCGDDNITFRFDRLPPGTYYLPVLRWDEQSTVGPYTIHVRCAPTCVLTCDGGTPEGEPNCTYGYVDEFNGGCNSTPPVFSTITCGQRICGKSGTYQETDTTRARDTDWYRLTLTSRAYLSWKAVAEFPVSLFVLDSTHCDSILILASNSGYACDTVEAVTAVLDPGEYWLFIAPSDINYVDCGADYIAWVDCVPCPVTCLTSDVTECTETPGPAHSDFDCNGGCNNTPYPLLYQDITCGTTVCGVGFNYNPTDTTSARDTDWYHFTLAERQRVSATIEAEFPVQLMILNYNCADIQVLAYGTTQRPCQPLAILTDSLNPGDYTVYVAPEYNWVFTYDGWAPYPSKYRMTLGCPCAPAIKATVNLNTTLTNTIVRWTAPAAGQYRVFSTTDKNSEFNPGTWTLETTVNVPSGAASWTDPGALVAFKRYAVQHVCQ